MALPLLPSQGQRRSSSPRQRILQIVLISLIGLLSLNFLRLSPPPEQPILKLPPPRAFDPNYRVADLQCEAYGGPVDRKATKEMVYWKDVR